ncbi:MAG: YCF48-related protein [Rhodocyclaceae bacterium]|nr:YCF48-related protein [Rhodocyclaceae bacterium]
MKIGASVLALLSSVVLAALPLTSNAFQDLLETPARASALAPSSLLNGLAQAGMRLVAVGQRGHILYSDDQGTSWTQATVPVSSDLTAVAFPSPTTGWAVGQDGIVLATRDSGVTWVKQLDGHAVASLLKEHYAAHPPNDLPGGADALAALQSDVARIAEEGADKPFLDVWFENESTGYVVGPFNLIFRTSDGGKNWVPLFDRTENPKRLHFYALHAMGDDLYLAGEQGMVLKFERKTQRFRAVPIDYKGTFFGLAHRGNTLLVFGLRGNVFRSDDRGATWQKVETGVSVALTAATSLPDGRLVLVSQAGHALVLADDGKSLMPLPVDRVPASAVVAGGPEALVIAGARGVHVKPIKQSPTP